MDEISPEELYLLKQIAQKIKAGVALKEVEFECSDGFILKITEPGMLEAVEKAALEVYEKYCQDDEPGNLSK